MLSGSSGSESFAFSGHFKLTSAVAAVDAPLVIPNQTGIRPAERDLNRDFRRFHAGCHAANLGRPFAEKVLSFSRRQTSAANQTDAEKVPARSVGTDALPPIEDAPGSYVRVRA